MLAHNPSLITVLAPSLMEVHRRSFTPSLHYTRVVQDTTTRLSGARVVTTVYDTICMILVRLVAQLLCTYIRGTAISFRGMVVCTRRGVFQVAPKDKLSTIFVESYAHRGVKGRGQFPTWNKFILEAPGSEVCVTQEG